MFIISLNYTAPLSDIDAHLDAHIGYLQRHYQQGIFLASGRKVPRTGGMILARAGSLEQVEQIVNQDPFVLAGVADVTITECHITKAGEQLQQLMDSPDQP